ncbi:inner membrane-spanning protein YciB [Novosphingobium cyanobacteriorum]|uniref:Inner membrane-spanning protein YciB n=1 Tax=Novosphingobium cyanobacteriorum TaxID=3024215 RepID=A0ABT6CM15_9SPHN|nr:inner membrane-spanning protein YciB [Novosphingobium cyanobacteriorum]MDF8334846.1 septation protein IspZ [Novosphingobium cyanobacteriorum]
MSADGKKAASSWVNLAVDYGPLLVFFLTYRQFSPKDAGGVGAIVAVTKGTIAFMVATVIALVVSKWRLGKISPMLWLSSALIIGFGALTVFLGDPEWIWHKPTAVYLMFALVLFAGWMRDKAALKYLLQSAFPGLNDLGWLKLSFNWAIFFLVLAALNEGLIAYLKHQYPDWQVLLKNDRDPITPIWLNAKLFFVTPISFLFTFTQIPMLLRHGLGETAENEVVESPPHD